MIGAIGGNRSLLSSNNIFRFGRGSMTRPRRSKQVNIQTQTSPVDSSTVLQSKSTIVKPKPSVRLQRKRKSKAESTETGLQSERPIAIPASDFSSARILGAEFYLVDALDLAPLLLGKFLRRDDVIVQITEVEAYRQNDTACHGRVGITARTAPLFGPGGHAYVYLCYGLHMMLNVVADNEGAGAAVLIRSCAPVSGLKTIQQRRGQITEKPVLLTGPGKVGQALGLSTEWSHHPLYTPGGLVLLDGPKPDKILVGPRVGIDYASEEDLNALWRFAIAGSPWVSAPKNTLRPDQS